MQSLLRRKLIYLKDYRNMATKIHCNDPVEFSEKLSEAINMSESSSGPLFVLFTGSKQASTGQSWCGDCRVAEPLIARLVNEMTSAVLLECTVDREPYRTPTYPYRTNNAIKLKCVPTLFRWTKRGPIASLDDSQCQVEELVTELLNT